MLQYHVLIKVGQYSLRLEVGTTIEEEWRFKKETYDRLLSDNRIAFPNKGKGKPRYKLFLYEKKEQGVIPNTWWENISSNQEASRELKAIFSDKFVFDTPKPVELIKFIFKMGSNKNSIILDFFSGSATATSLMDLNAEDGGSRKYHGSTSEETDKIEAYKAGYKNISEIGKDVSDEQEED